MRIVARIWKNYSWTLFLAFIIVGLYDVRIANLALICMLGPAALALFRGRTWCGAICPRGSFYDNLASKWAGRRLTPLFFRSIPFRLAVIAIMAGVFSLSLASTAHNDTRSLGVIFYRLIVGTSIIGIALSVIFNQRTWCSFCPMGTFASLVARAGKKRTKLSVGDNCISCGLCARSCPMGISPESYRGAELTHPDCIHCARCVHVCPKSIIGYPKNS